MTSDNSDNYTKLVQLIEHSRHNDSLVRLSIVKGRGVKLSIACKILNFDEQTRNLSVYDVDQKKVHLISMYEIDDFIVDSRMS